MPTYAAGKVVTGFSKPYVAAYTYADNAITYTNAQELARGVKVSLEPESSDASNFYANNIVAETEGGGFTGATLTLTVDGLFASAERFILGLQAAGEDGFSDYNSSSKAPFVGVGFIVRSMSNHNTLYTPVVLYKTMFKQPTQEAETQGDEINWQTTELEATVMRADTSDLRWKAVGSDYDTEADALTALQTKLGVEPPTPPGP
jgi:phi13 family phage major tail protein